VKAANEAAKARSDGTRPHTDGLAQDYDGAFDTLRVALLDFVAGTASAAQLRIPIRQLCVFAHSEDMKAEELLVRFKEVWASLPPLAELPRGRQRNDLMAQVATMCIEEFYGPPGGDRARRD
jgi:hypothetical protein